jgi:carbon storage regulator
MLVVTRACNESVLIGDNVEVVVLRIDHGQVRIGIKAPRDVTVLRSELGARVTTESPQAGAGTSDTAPQASPPSR